MKDFVVQVAFSREITISQVFVFVEFLKLNYKMVNKLTVNIVDVKAVQVETDLLIKSLLKIYMKI